MPHERRRRKAREKDVRVGHETCHFVARRGIQSRVHATTSSVAESKPERRRQASHRDARFTTHKRPLVDTSVGASTLVHRLDLRAAMLLLPLLALFSLPLCLARTRQQVHDELVKLSTSNNGLIVLDDRTYGMLTAPDRDWSATVVFTAMDPRRKCAPCK